MKHILTLVLSFAVILLGASSTQALAGNEFKAGRIIDDSVFFSSDISAATIQSFLNAKVPTCDTQGSQSYAGTTRAAYGTSKGYPPPYICIKNYTQDTPTKAAEAGLCAQYNGGTKTAAQIIYDVGAACGISQRALIILLEKEQSLITDDWPWSTQYRSATGYGCPDTAPCDAEYYGFFNQVYSAARQFKRYARDSTSFSKRAYRDNYIQYNPNANCWGSNVFIQNQATASLYNYTPYQPNEAALNNLYGSGDGCSAYGNRNFWRMFNDWFGSTTGSATPYAWSILSVDSYYNSSRSAKFSRSPVIDLQPGNTAYITIKAKNSSYETWTQSIVHMGTTYPQDRISKFANDTWLSPQRLGMQENSVAPGGTGTFSFSVKAPNVPGTYIEHLSLVADGITWMNDPNLYLTINVSTPSASSNSQNTSLLTGQHLSPGKRLMSPDSQSIFTLLPNGKVALYSDFIQIWDNGVSNPNAQSLVLQPDGNLVEYDNNGVALWATGTSGTGNYLALQTDGNVVLYNSSNIALWSTGTVSTPSHLNKVNTSLPYNGVLYPGQFIQTADKAHTLVLQNDGNLVEYNASGRPIWASGTQGENNILVSQGDGNIVMYKTNGQAIWASGTNGRGNSLSIQPGGTLTVTSGNNSLFLNKPLYSGQAIQTADRAYALALQNDGNLVLYNSAGQAIWATGTRGAGNVLVSQTDGNIVLYANNGVPLWATGTRGFGNVFAVQSDGNLVVYANNGSPFWSRL